MSSWAEIHAAARLLLVPPECLEGTVTRRVTVSAGLLRRWVPLPHPLHFPYPQPPPPPQVWHGPT